MRTLWRAHYSWPWWARWFTWHWWKAKIWEANHSKNLGCVPEEVWTRSSYTGPLSAGSGYVPVIDTRETEKALDYLMAQHMKKNLSCHTSKKNDGQT